MKTTTYDLLGLLSGSIPYLLGLIFLVCIFEWYTWPVLVLWTACSIIRAYNDDPKLRKDCFIFSTFNIMQLREAYTVWEALALSSIIRKPMFSVLTFGLALLLFIHRVVILYLNRTMPLKAILRPEFKTYTPPEHLKPLIFPCQTTHARVFPKMHSFRYSYLLFGFPIFPKTIAADGTRYGGMGDDKWGKWWLQVRAEDYLERGYGTLGFFEKLKMTLKSQGVQDSEWSYAYLITAPRFFGYSFNPVSFWYIYDEYDGLKKMILEVNNTFGERRLYVLHDSSPVMFQGPNSNTMDGLQTSQKRFVGNWPKDFHVSPFNSRKGQYSLKALNPFPFPSNEPSSIDNTITLLSSKNHTKIIARVHSTGVALDPINLGTLGTIQFIRGWFWVGLLTFPRILKEAFKLLFYRSLNVWFRPEVLPSSIGRAPTSVEIVLQNVFQDYLCYLINETSEQLDITYYTAIPDKPKVMLGTTHVQGSKVRPKVLNIRVLSPLFYTRFIFYAHSSEAINRECLFVDEKNRTLEISPPELIPLLFHNSTFSCSRKLCRSVKRSYISRKRWSLLRFLRCPVPAPSYQEIATLSNVKISDIRSLPFSDLDAFMQTPYGCSKAGSYRRTVTKVFLAQRFTFGFVEVIDIADFLLRIFLSYVGSSMLFMWAQEAQRHGLGRTLVDIPDTCVAELRGTHTKWFWIVRLGIWTCACHLYGMLKGYR